MIVTDIWHSQPGDYFCISTLNDDKRFHSEFFKRNELCKVDAFIRECRDLDIYWSVNAYSSPRRTKENAVRGKFLYADLDPVDPRKLKLRPTIAWETSPGNYHALWQCNTAASDELNQRLVRHVGADKDSHARNKVLRVPGTWNYKPKYDRAHRVKLLWDDGPTYLVKDLERDLPVNSQPQPRFVRRSAVANWKKLTGRELAHRYGVKRLAFASHWNRRYIVIHSVWGPMVEGGASLEEIEHALDDCPAWHSKLEEHGSAWGSSEIKRIENAMEKPA